MKAVPDSFDKDFWIEIIKLVSKLAILAGALVGGSSAVEQVAHSDLKKTEAVEKTDAAWSSYGDYANDVLKRQAICDANLDSFHRHRHNFVEEDWQAVLDACHSDGK